MKRNSGGKGRELFGVYDFFMNEALKEAEKARLKGEAPIGAVIVKDGSVIARGHNTKESKNDPTLHAEMNAIRSASKKLESWRLNGCEMYVTLEPCPMCAGAVIQARIDKLYIGTSDPKAGAVGSVINLMKVEGFNHRVEVMYGILEEECTDVLKNFFRELRDKKV